MTSRLPKPAVWLYPALIVVLVALFWSGSWHAGLGKSDFPGHVGLIATLSEQLNERFGLHLWTADWNSGSSLVFWYIQPLISSFLLLPFVAQWGIIDGIRIGDSFFLALAGLSMYAWCSHLTRSNHSAFIGALMYVLHPSVFMFVGAAGQIHQPVSMAIIPLLFLAFHRLAEAPNRENALFAMITSALLFYDMERFWLILPHVLIVYAVVVLANSKAGRRSIQLRKAGTFAIATGVGMSLLVAFPTLPAIFERPLLQWHDLMSIEVFRQYYSFPHLLALVDRGGMLARPLDPLIPRAFASLPGQWYQGIVALFFVTVGTLLFGRKPADLVPRAQLLVALLLLVSALLIAFGVHAIGPKHWLLFGDLADRPLGFALSAKLLLLAVFIASFFLAIAHLLLTTLVRRWPGHRILWAVFLIGLVGVFLFAKPFELLSRTIFIYAHLRAPSHFAFPALPFMLATAACLVTPAWLRAVGTNRGSWLIVTVAVLHLIDVHPYRFRADWSYPEAVVREWEASYSTLDELPPGRMLDTHHYNPVADMLTLTTAKRDMAWGWLSWTSTKFVGDIIKTGFFDSMRIARLRPEVREPNVRVASELSALANVRFVSRIAGISPALPPSPYFHAVSENSRVVIYENRKALAYLQFYPQLALLTGTPDETVPLVGALAQEGIASLTLEGNLPVPELAIDYWHGARAASLAPAQARELEHGPPFQIGQNPLNPGNEAPCQITARGSASIHLDCQFERRGTLVLAEAWFPNWRVSVNGVSRPSLRLNHAFQGVPVEPGRARIEFEHLPSVATRIGKLVSATSWIAIVGLWIYFSRPSARAARIEP